MSFSVSRLFSWVFAACLFATLPSAIAAAQDSTQPSGQPAAQPPAQTAPPQTTPAPPRVVVPPAAPPEAPVAATYDNKYEISGGFAYDHFRANPQIQDSSNLGGFNIIGTRWLNGRLGAAASVRGYYGTTGTAPNTFGIKGPFIDQYLFVFGPELRGPHNANLSTSIHALFGGAHGNFDSDLKGQPPASVGILPNQTVFASAIGGSIDLNRSPRLAYRITPELILTRYNGDPSNSTQYNFGFTAGILYRFR